VPDIINHAYLSIDLKVSRDCLCLYTTFYGSIYASYFQAWIMKEHGPKASWTLLSRFRIDELPRCKYWVDLVFVTENLYNPREDAFKRFTIQLSTFIKSLVSSRPRLFDIKMIFYKLFFKFSCVYLLLKS
jgi:hypothetical protein